MSTTESFCWGEKMTRRPLIQRPLEFKPWNIYIRKFDFCVLHRAEFLCISNLFLICNKATFQLYRVCVYEIPDVSNFLNKELSVLYVIAVLMWSMPVIFGCIFAEKGSQISAFPEEEGILLLWTMHINCGAFRLWDAKHISEDNWRAFSEV